MATSLENESAFMSNCIKEAIMTHLPKRENFNFDELDAFLHDLGMTVSPAKIAGAVQIILAEHDDPVDGNKPVLDSRDNQFVFRFGAL